MSSIVPQLPQQGCYSCRTAYNAFMIVHLTEDYELTKVVKAIANQPFMVGFVNTPINDDHTQPGKFGDPGIIYFSQLIQGNYNREILETVVGLGFDLFSNIFQGVPAPDSFKEFRDYGTEGTRPYIPNTGGDIFIQVKTSNIDLAHIIMNEFLRLLDGQYIKEKTHPVYSDGKIPDYGSKGKNEFGYYDATSRTTVLPPECNVGWDKPRGHEDFHCLTQNPLMDVGPFMDYVDYNLGTTKIHDWGRMVNALIQNDKFPLHNNGSFILALQFEYDRLQEFLKLDVEMPLDGTPEQKKNTQNGTFGRRKNGPFAGGPGDIPLNCHTLKNFQPIEDQTITNTFEQQFIERSIYRQAGEYKEPGDEQKGVGRLFFTAYHFTCDTFDILLGNMTGEREDVNQNKEPDLLFNYVVCHSGQQFYAPNWRELVTMGSLYKDGNPNYSKTH